MNICTQIILIFAVLTLAYTQINYNNNCQNNSLLPLLATGVANLNPLDTSKVGASKDYYVDLSLAQFTNQDSLGYGFAISGFQASCGQAYYTLIIDKIIFENQNTRMKITINFLNPSTYSISNFVTNWNYVSFTYIIVSKKFQGSYSNIWAMTAEIFLNRNIDGKPIDSSTNNFNGKPGTNCQVYSDSNLIFPYNPATLTANSCDIGVKWNEKGNGGQLIFHAYIMGFQWNSNKNTNNFLNASIFATNPSPTIMNSEDA